MQIAFNVRYLLDGLKALGSDQVVLHCNAPQLPQSSSQMVKLKLHLSGDARSDPFLT